MSRFSAITPRAKIFTREKTQTAKADSSSSEEKKLPHIVPKPFPKTIPRPQFNRRRNEIETQHLSSSTGEESKSIAKESKSETSGSESSGSPTQKKINLSISKALVNIVPKDKFKSTRPSSARSPRVFLSRNATSVNKAPAPSSEADLLLDGQPSPEVNHETTPPPHLINFPSLPQYVRGSASKRTAFAKSKRQDPVQKRGVFATKANADAKKTRLQRIRGTLPTGVNLDDNGNLTGTTYLIATPKFREGDSPAFEGREDMAFQDYFNQVSNNALNGNLAEVAGQKIAPQARSDFFRLDYEFCDEDGNTFRSYELDIPKDKQKERNEAVTLALRAFSGSDAATTVLSAILHQSTAATIVRGLRSVDGFEMAHLRMISAMNAEGRKVYVVNEDGSREHIVKPLGLAGAKFRLSKHGNDFKLSIEWQMYYEAKLGQEEFLPLVENEMIGVHCQAEFFVHGDTAHTTVTTDDNKERNFMELTIPDGGIQATFSGRLKLD